MDTQQAYDLWAQQYDTNKNKTRDVEAVALRDSLKNVPFKSCLEVGCGTGKNTLWLSEKAQSVLAVDLSGEMLVKAKEKTAAQHNISFKQVDITQPWTFASGTYDLVSFSLVLEHIKDLGPIFKEASAILENGGHLYIGELHPFKQYTGTKARFETEEGRQVLSCFNHHISDFVTAAKGCGLELVDLQEYFDQDERSQLPRILALLFKKPETVQVSIHQ